MSERNEVEIRDELKNCKSTRKAMVKLSRMVSNKHINSNLKCIYFGLFETTVYSNDKIGFARGCHNCKKITKGFDFSVEQFKSNTNKIVFIICLNCIKSFCHSCFRETSRCSIIHTRKLLCYKFLLSQKFPKDVIRLIVKKVK